LTHFPAEFLKPFADPMDRGVQALAQRHPDPLLFLEQVQDRRVEFGRRGLIRSAVSESRGIALETGGEGGTTAHMSGPSPDRIGDLVRSLLCGESPPVAASDSGPIREVVELEEAGPVVDSILAQVPLGHDGARVRVRGRHVQYSQEVRIASASSGQFTELREGRRIRLVVELHRNGREGIGTVDWVWRPGRDLDPACLVAGAIARAEARLDARPAPCGRFPVVMAPGVGGILVHEMFGHALEGRGSAVEASALVRRGEGPRSREIRIIDDPRRGRIPWRRDDEGERARAVALVADGRLAGSLHNRTTAQVVGDARTGHGRRSSYLVPALPRMGCTFIAAGNHDPASLVKETDDGLYIRRMAAASIDLYSGEAMFRVSDADRIEGGRIAAPLEPFVLFVTLAETLATLGQPANDLQFDTCLGTCLKEHQPLAVTVGAPTVRLGVATVL
jgi:predicted Zn-dependent protease